MADANRPRLWSPLFLACAAILLLAALGLRRVTDMWGLYAPAARSRGTFHPECLTILRAPHG